MNEISLPQNTRSLAPSARGDEPEILEEQPPVNPLLRLHVLLYGRYRIAIALAVILSLCAAAAAWFLTPPKYEIVGGIRIKSYVPNIMNSSEQNGMMPAFEAFVDFQVALMQSQRVMERARSQPDWKPFLKRSTNSSTADLSDTLEVEHQKGSEIITVTATDRNLDAASAAVRSLLAAYMDISGEGDEEGDGHRLAVLQDRLERLQKQQRLIRDNIRDLANVNGSDDLSLLYQEKVTDMNKLEGQLQDIARDLALNQAMVSAGLTTEPATQPATSLLSPGEIAAVDVTMREYLTRKNALNSQLTHQLTTLGESNQQVRSTRMELDAVEQAIQKLMDEYKARGTSNLSLPGSRDRLRPSDSILLAQQKNLAALRDALKKEAQELGRKDLQIKDLKQQEQDITRKVNEATSRLEQLNLEGPIAGRISIMSNGERPSTPPKSKRVPITVAGGMGGFGAGIGLVALWGLVGRRVRSVMQVEQLQPSIPVLGVLPILNDERADPEQKRLAAHCVHQIRNLLDSGSLGHTKILGITSPCAGDGKTNLTLALGISFATAGSRTLLIDCDIVGGGLSGRVNTVVRGSVGAILRKGGLITAAQLQEVEKLAFSTSRTVEDVLVNLGYVTQDDIQRACALQDESSFGLLNALDGDSVSSCIAEVLCKDLFLLPLGDAAVHHTTQMSPKAFRRILKEAGEMFDVIIVDTGPILGSLEASIVVREVDEVVLAVSRDGKTTFMNRAVASLQTLGVNIAGVVFNRATPHDIFSSHYGSSASSASVRSSQTSRGYNGGGASPQKPSLGPLALAVVNSSANGSVKEQSDHANSD